MSVSLPSPARLPANSPAEDAAWALLCAKVAEIEHIDGVLGLLEWDQQTMMPAGGAAARGAQVSLLHGIQHRMTIDAALGDAVAQLADSADVTRRAAARVIGRRHHRAVQVPEALVTALSEARSAGFSAWMTARGERSFAPFADTLDRIISLSRELAACHGPAAHPYDNLLAEFDPGSSVSTLAPMFARLADGLSGLVEAAAERGPPAALDLTIPEAVLDRVNRRVLESLGFRMQDGRLDPAEHPFTVGMHPGDVRLTTHNYATDVLGTLGGTIHEAGHGMYEQGMPVGLRGTGLCAAAGVGLHESQSRFWENHIGRSAPFFAWLAPMLKEEGGIDVQPWQLYGAANRVQPSLVRVKADEATYNLHIIARFELETAMIAGDVSTAELPDAWDAAYQRLLGVSASNPVDGVLQDVHWSSGYLGYFPSYTIGNLYAASFEAAMVQDLPGLWEDVRRGEFAPVLAWLREKVHQRGALVDAPEVFADAVGPRDPVADLVRHLYRRHGNLLELDLPAEWAET